MRSMINLNQNIINAVLFATPEPLFIYDENGCYVKVLGGTDHKHYHDGQHLVGKRMHDLMDRSIADKFLTQIQKAIKTDEIIHYTYQLSADDIKGSEKLPGPKGKLWFEAHISPIQHIRGLPRLVAWLAFNITELKKTLLEKEKLIKDLKKARTEINTLQTILPICSGCKKIRNEKGGWEQIDSYIQTRSDTSFTHSMCPECSDKMYGTEDWYIQLKKKQDENSD